MAWPGSAGTRPGRSVGYVQAKSAASLWTLCTKVAPGDGLVVPSWGRRQVHWGPSGHEVVVGRAEGRSELGPPASLLGAWLRVTSRPRRLGSR